jgi:uncharacterized membrane protein
LISAYIVLGAIAQAIIIFILVLLIRAVIVIRRKVKEKGAPINTVNLVVQSAAFLISIGTTTVLYLYQVIHGIDAHDALAIFVVARGLLFISDLFLFVILWQIGTKDPEPVKDESEIPEIMTASFDSDAKEQARIWNLFARKPNSANSSSVDSVTKINNLSKSMNVTTNSSDLQHNSTRLLKSVN